MRAVTSGRDNRRRLGFGRFDGVGAGGGPAFGDRRRRLELAQLDQLRLAVDHLDRVARALRSAEREVVKAFFGAVGPAHHHFEEIIAAAGRRIGDRHGHGTVRLGLCLQRRPDVIALARQQRRGLGQLCAIAIRLLCRLLNRHDALNEAHAAAVEEVAVDRQGQKGSGDEATKFTLELRPVGDHQRLAAVTFGSPFREADECDDRRAGHLHRLGTAILLFDVNAG
jgi:hypothetical protein